MSRLEINRLNHTHHTIGHDRHLVSILNAGILQAQVDIVPLVGTQIHASLIFEHPQSMWEAQAVDGARVAHEDIAGGAFDHKGKVFTHRNHPGRVERQPDLQLVVVIIRIIVVVKMVVDVGKVYESGDSALCRILRYSGNAIWFLASLYTKLQPSTPRRPRGCVP